jgi:hypothetical protein
MEENRADFVQVGEKSIWQPYWAQKKCVCFGCLTGPICLALTLIFFTADSAIVSLTMVTMTKN